MATRVALVGQPCKAEILRHPCDLVIGLSGIQRYPKLFALEQFWVRKDIGKVLLQRQPFGKHNGS